MRRQLQLLVLFFCVIFTAAAAWADPAPAAKAPRFRAPALRDIRQARGRVTVGLKPGTHTIMVTPDKGVDVVIPEGTTARVTFGVAPGGKAAAARVRLSNPIKVKNGVRAGSELVGNGWVKTLGKVVGVVNPSVSVSRFTLSLKNDGPEPMLVAQTKGYVSLLGVPSAPLVPISLPLRALKPLIANLEPELPGADGLRAIASEALGVATNANGMIRGKVDMANPLAPGQTTPVEFRADFSATPSPRGITLEAGELTLDGLGIKGSFRAAGEIELK